MAQFFTAPYFLSLSALYALFLWRWTQHRTPLCPHPRVRSVWFSLHAAAVTALILAAAGLRIPYATQHVKLAIAADVSESVFDLNAQNVRLRELLGALNRDSAEASVTIFAETPGLERPMAALPDPEISGVASRRRDEGNSTGQASALPDLTHTSSVVGRSGTDIGAALAFARGTLTDAAGPRGILLLSDFRETRGHADASAAALQGSGIDLLVSPAVLGPVQDIQLVSLRVPETATVGRATPIEITVAAMQTATVRVSVWREGAGKNGPLSAATVTLTAEPGMHDAEIRKTVRILDTPDTPGIAIYSAMIHGIEGPLPGDIRVNNNLSAAVRVTGPSRWAVLTRSASTLEQLCADKNRPLGVESQCFLVNALPSRPDAYNPFSGILIDGLSADELPEGSTALNAIARATAAGKGLVALGGARAYGAGRHAPECTWEQLLPVQMTPEDDRTRAVVIVIDISKSMDEKMLSGGSRVRKMDHAAGQLALALEKLRPQDRLGLVAFSGSAHVAAPLSNDPSHSAFLGAIKSVTTQASTDLYSGLTVAREMLKSDDSEEQLVVLLSDGIQTVQRPREELLRSVDELCPIDARSPEHRRTTLYTFGIGTGDQDANPTGETLMKDLASAGGGQFSPDFARLAERLEKTLAAGEKDFYVRHDPFSVKAGLPHPLLAGAHSWPQLTFRNRVKAKPDAEAILFSADSAADGTEKRTKNRPDPLLVLSGPNWPGVSRRAALALTLDGDAGEELLAAEAPGRALLPALLDWVEVRSDSATHGWTLNAEPADDGSLEIELRGKDLASGKPMNGLKPIAIFTPLATNAAGEPPTPRSESPLHAVAPGRYRAKISVPPASVGRLSVTDGALTLSERFVSTPCAAEMRRFSVDRAAMTALAAQAGSSARVIETPRDLAQWASSKTAKREGYELRPWLLALALILLLAEIATRQGVVHRKP